MKLILHIGMPKSGSTAIQRALRRSRRALARHRIAYPAGGALPKNHNMLICALTEGNGLPRLFRQIYGDDSARMRGDVAIFLQQLRNVIPRRKTDTIILSSEMLFRALDAEERAQLMEILRSMADTVEVVAYVRSPASFYISKIQQGLKARSSIPRPQPVSYRAEIESYAPLADRLTIAAYDRQGFVGGDIAQDFLSRVAPEAVDALEDGASAGANASLSAEGMDILQRYRAANHSGKDGRFTPDTGELMRAIAAEEAHIKGLTRPVAHAHVREYLDSASVDLLWLRDRFGAVFPDIDYTRIDPHPDPDVDTGRRPKWVAEICPLDAKRARHLEMRVLHQMAKRLTGDSRMRFKTAMPDLEPAAESASS